ncbi:5-oxoprolinase/urea amidolyase family protein [Pseudonocardia sp. MCCB 268]|nr:5-oxoprolinase/urea amidolyase family protein [Pseudonocardia cytotoxica]
MRSLTASHRTRPARHAEFRGQSSTAAGSDPTASKVANGRAAPWRRSWRSLGCRLHGALPGSPAGAPMMDGPPFPSPVPRLDSPRPRVPAPGAVAVAGPAGRSSRDGRAGRMGVLQADPLRLLDLDTVLRPRVPPRRPDQVPRRRAAGIRRPGRRNTGEPSIKLKARDDRAAGITTTRWTWDAVAPRGARVPGRQRHGPAGRPDGERPWSATAGTPSCWRTATGLSCTFATDVLVAVTGAADGSKSSTGSRASGSEPVSMTGNRVLLPARPPEGLRSYLAVHGGLVAPLLLGSAARTQCSGSAWNCTTATWSRCGGRSRPWTIRTFATRSFAWVAPARPPLRQARDRGRHRGRIRPVRRHRGSAVRRRSWSATAATPSASG